MFVCARRSRRRQCDARKSRTDRAGTGAVGATIKTRLTRERDRPHTIRHSSSAVFVVVVVDRQTRSPQARAHRRFKQVFRFGERARTRKSREKRASRAERKLENQPRARTERRPAESMPSISRSRFAMWSVRNGSVGAVGRARPKPLRLVVVADGTNESGQSRPSGLEKLDDDEGHRVGRERRRRRRWRVRVVVSARFRRARTSRTCTSYILYVCESARAHAKRESPPEHLHLQFARLYIECRGRRRLPPRNSVH